jgi:hypothetical protein
MTTKAELEEKLELEEADNAALEAEVEELRGKLKRSIADYKGKLKKAAKASEGARQEAFEAAKSRSVTLTKRARKIYKELKQTDRSLIGVAAIAALDAQIELIEKLFNDL